jgi:hypothetical protein
MSGTRFTTWLGEDERAALRALAHEHHVSENFVMRMAVRALLFGDPIPTWLQQTREKLRAASNR